ncbi:DUF3817 domain-containing protein [Microbacterium sp. G2-8]|uniref:DUF3817 domain-containing protein n=1 Tax=Microbacterium sp. G2-8 TaxID=2842454 RepID=UPI0027E265D5|nr:DUF3817 domain-containing protein [Microbacterium sp. G2-8]
MSSVDVIAPTRTSRLGRAWAVIATIEAITWAGLLIGMLIKYPLEGTHMVVTIFGSLHGAAFIVYGILTIVAAVRLRWGWWRALIALACSIPPLFTLIVEVWFAKAGMLRVPASADQV